MTKYLLYTACVRFDSITVTFDSNTITWDNNCNDGFYVHIIHNLIIQKSEQIAAEFRTGKNFTIELTKNTRLSIEFDTEGLNANIFFIKGQENKINL